MRELCVLRSCLQSYNVHGYETVFHCSVFSYFCVGADDRTQQTAKFEHCANLPLMRRDSHPERVVFLGQIGEDVGVEQSGLQEAAPQSSQLGAELAHVPADLLRYLLVALLQLIGDRKKKKQISVYNKTGCMRCQGLPKICLLF